MKIGNYLVLLILSFVFAQADALLPKNVLVEQYLISAQRYESKNDYVKARKEFEKIEALQENLPDQFYFLYGQNLYRTDDYAKAKEYFSVYLRKVSRDAKYYKDALDYLGRIDEKDSDEGDRRAACEGLGPEITAELEKCEQECAQAVDDQIMRDMEKYPYVTTTELYNKWYPQCMSEFKRKRYNQLTSDYRKNKCKEYE